MFYSKMEWFNNIHLTLDTYFFKKTNKQKEQYILNRAAHQTISRGLELLNRTNPEPRRNQYTWKLE